MHISLHFQNILCSTEKLKFKQKIIINVLILNIHKVKTLFEHARFIKKVSLFGHIKHWCEYPVHRQSKVKWNPILGGFQVIKKNELKEEEKEEERAILQS